MRDQRGGAGRLDGRTRRRLALLGVFQPRCTARRLAPDSPAGTTLPPELLLMLLMSPCGSIFLYQGEELGLPQANVPFDQLRDPEAIANWPITLGRDAARTPMPWCNDSRQAGFSEGEPWLPVDARHLPLAIDLQASDSKSPLHFTRKPIALRRVIPALRHGAFAVSVATRSLLAFERSDGNARDICVFNFGDRPVSLEDSSLVEVLLTADSDGRDTSSLPPMNGLIAELAPNVEETGSGRPRSLS